MAEVTRRRRGEIVKKVFEILFQHPEGMVPKDLLPKVAQALTLSDYEKSEYPNHPGVRRFENIVRFLTIKPVKAGWLVKSAGRWILTEEGKRAYQQYPDPEDLVKRAGALYRAWRDSQPDQLQDEEEIPVESATTTLEQAEELAWAEIGKHLRTMNPFDLQKLVAALLRAMDYYVAWVSPPGPDKGIDILAYTDPLGTRAPRIKVQVKRQESSISVEGLRSFMAVLGEEDVGIFVCTGGFTANAQSEARTQQIRKVTLLDMEKLVELWVEHYSKLEETEKRLLPLKPVYYLAGLE